MIKKLAQSIREYRRATILTPLAVTGEVILECIIPLIMARLIDNMNGTFLPPVIRYGIMLVVLSLCSLFCGAMSGRYAATASNGFAKNLRRDLFFRIQDFDFADIDHFQTSSLITRMTTDVTNVQNAFQMLIRIAVRTPLMLVFSVVMSMLISVKMSLIFLCILPVLGVFLFSVIRLVFGIFQRIFQKYDALNNFVQENVAGIRVVKAFVREEDETARFRQAAEDVRRDFTRAEKILALNSPMMTLAVNLAVLSVSYIGARLIIFSHETALTTGGLSSLISYGMQMLMSMMMLSMVFVMLSMSAESARRINEVLNHTTRLTSPVGGVSEVKEGSIDFEGVSFSYSQDSTRPALEGINLHIDPGMTVGIIGGTGSAKSTLIQLIPRLYDATAGTVRVGGIDVREYELSALRDAVAVVLQKNVVFTGTVRDNLRWGNMEAAEEELVRACRLAQADDFIRRLPQGYDTPLSQGGTNISGGQKQRLCIARALLKKPRVLILDDSTSAVDTRTDALIRRALQQEMQGTTKLIIAQRIASVQDADLILVLEGGRIVEQGRHEELLAQAGIYREIFDSQTRQGGDAA